VLSWPRILGFLLDDCTGRRIVEPIDRRENEEETLYLLFHNTMLTYNTLIISGRLQAYSCTWTTRIKCDMSTVRRISDTGRSTVVMRNTGLCYPTSLLSTTMSQIHHCRAPWVLILSKSSICSMLQNSHAQPGSLSSS